MNTPEPCTHPSGHLWEETDVSGCDLCGEHSGLQCLQPGCWETVDLVWEADPRDLSRAPAEPS
jgi:hypothetical protein